MGLFWRDCFLLTFYCKFIDDTCLGDKLITVNNKIVSDKWDAVIYEVAIPLYFI